MFHLGKKQKTRLVPSRKCGAGLTSMPCCVPLGVLGWMARVALIDLGASGWQGTTGCLEGRVLPVSSSRGAVLGRLSPAFLTEQATKSSFMLRG